MQVANLAAASAPIVAPAFRNKLITIAGHSDFPVASALKRAAFEQMTAHAAKGRLVTDVERTGLDEIAQTRERFKQGGGTKIVVTP